MKPTFGPMPLHLSTMGAEDWLWEVFSGDLGAMESLETAMVPRLFPCSTGLVNPLCIRLFPASLVLQSGMFGIAGITAAEGILL